MLQFEKVFVFLNKEKKGINIYIPVQGLCNNNEIRVLISDYKLKQGLSVKGKGIKENGLDKLFGHIKTFILI